MSSRSTATRATARAAASTSGPASVSTDRLWSTSECTSSSERPAAATSGATSRPVLMLITHSSTRRQTPTVQIGLALPQYDYSVPGRDHVDWPTLVETATHAERLGFSSLWLADHLSMSIEKYGGPPGEHRGFDPIP